MSDNPTGYVFEEFDHQPWVREMVRDVAAGLMLLSEQSDMEHYVTAQRQIIRDIFLANECLTSRVPENADVEDVADAFSLWICQQATRHAQQILEAMPEVPDEEH